MGAFSQGPCNQGTLAPLGRPQQFQKFFVDTWLRQQFLTGVTKDAAGTPLGGCTVEVYETIAPLNLNEPKGRFVGSVVSNPDGTFRIPVYAGPDASFRTVVYKAGAPDVAGTSVNTLIGT